ncbi:sensor histidine kinase [Thalassiella azotivora]
MLTALRDAMTRSGSSTLGTDWDRPPPDARGLRIDLVAGLAVTVVTLVMVEMSRSAGMLEYGPQRGVAESLLWGAAIALPLTVRRRYPLAVLTVSSAVFLASGLRAPSVAATFMVQICFFSALYTAAAWGRGRHRTTGLFGVVCLVMFAWLAFQLALGGMVDDLADTGRTGALPPLTAAVLVTVVINVVYFVGAWMIGTSAWRAARQRTELRLQTQRLEREQAISARRAVAADRLRIARELHDVVAHHVSVIGVQAAAARRTLEKDPDAARRAMGAVEESSRAAVGEMRSLLGVLRSGDEAAEAAESFEAGVADEGGDGGRRAGAPAPGTATAPGGPPGDVTGRAGGSGASDRSPQPGVSRLPDLCAQVREQGVDVRLTVVGSPVELPSTLSLSLYRTVQEALANVRRHSTARTAHVTLRYPVGGPGAVRGADGDAARGADGGRPGATVEVEVLDDGRPRGATSGSGLGHLGMRERAQLHGGVAEIGPRPFGGYRVRVRLPLVVRDEVATAAGHHAPTPQVGQAVR